MGAKTINAMKNEVKNVVDVHGLTTNEKLSNGSKKSKAKVCPICRKRFYGYGNNCSPLWFTEPCCDCCNVKVVIPVRLLLDDYIYNH